MEENTPQPRSSLTTRFSDFANDNILLVRYCTGISVGGLIFYGITASPLFFRYRRLQEIPKSFFRERRRFSGRLIRVDDQNRLQVRHLSIVERCLPLTWWKTFLNLHPSSFVTKEFRDSDLLRIQLPSINVLRDPLLREMERTQSLVSLQLMGTQQMVLPTGDTVNKRPIPGISPDGTVESAVARVTFPCKSYLWWSDLGQELVQRGHARVADVPISISDATTDPNDLKTDVRYLDMLERAEIEATKKEVGVWSTPDYVKEHGQVEPESVLSRLQSALRLRR